MFNTKMSKWLIWFGAITAIIAVFMIVSNLGEKSALSRYLPYGLLLLCPLSHLFMMNMHPKSHHTNKDDTKDDSSCH